MGVCVCVYSSSDKWQVQLSATNSVNSFANIYSSTDDTAWASKQQVATEITGKGRITAATYQINLPYAGHFIYFTMGWAMPLNFFFLVEIQAST